MPRRLGSDPHVNPQSIPFKTIFPCSARVLQIKSIVVPGQSCAKLTTLSKRNSQTVLIRITSNLFKLAASHPTLQLPNLPPTASLLAQLPVHFPSSTGSLRLLVCPQPLSRNEPPLLNLNFSIQPPPLPPSPSRVPSCRHLISAQSLSARYAAAWS